MATETDLREPLLQKCLEKEKLPAMYVLVFPNVFGQVAQERDNSDQTEPRITAEQARRDLGDLLDRIKDSNLSTYRPKLWNQISKLIFAEESELTSREHRKGLLTAVIWVIRYACQLQVELYNSRDRDEVFCLLSASEAVLKKRAFAIEYSLQMTPAKELIPIKGDKAPEYTEVPPYIQLIKGSTSFELLKRYDELTGEEAPKGSLFTFPDKVRLVRSILANFLTISQLQEFNLVITHYCVHNSLHLDQLKPKWASIKNIGRIQPLDEVRNYFGEKVTMYFGWVGVYGWCMCFTAAAGTFAYVLNEIWPHHHEAIAVGFALYLAFWAAFNDQIWVRKEKKLAWKWGVIDYSEVEEQREQFIGVGEPVLDVLTGRLKKASSKSQLLFRQAISHSVVGLCVMLVIIAVLGIFLFRATMLRDPKDAIVDVKYVSLVCAVLNFLQIKIMNLIYTRIARKMTDWENHETESKDEDSFNVKVALFRFVNCYISLFYIAFVKKHQEGCLNDDCEAELEMQLTTIFLMNIAMNLIELGWPYFNYKLKDWYEERQLRHRARECPEFIDSFEMSYTEKQAKLDPYETPMNDYMEMACQYGYVIMFSSVFPIIGVFALLEILIEVRVDAWKLCVMTRRPFPHRSESIGIWSGIMELLSYMGIVTNAALIMFTRQSISIDLLPGGPWPNFILLEHLLLGLKVMVSLLIPDEPTVVLYGLMWSHRVAAEQIFAKRVNYKAELKLSLSRELKELLNSKKELCLEERVTS